MFMRGISPGFSNKASAERKMGSAICGVQREAFRNFRGLHTWLFFYPNIEGVKPYVTYW
jgi:hypothetical protein